MSASFVIASQEVPKDAAVVSLAGHRLKLGKFVRRVGEYLEFEHTRPMQSVVECAHRGDDFSICRVTRQPKEEAARAVRDITHILVAVAWKPSLAAGREQQQAIEYKVRQEERGGGKECDRTWKCGRGAEK